MRRATGDVATTSTMAAAATRARTTGVTAATSPVPYAGSAERTAEIPVVRPPERRAGRRARQPVELGDGTLWYPGVSRRLPAPFGLRLLVWLLMFALLVGLGGLAVERYHPDWISFLRRVGPSAPTVDRQGAGSGNGSGTGAAQSGRNGTGSGSGLRLVSSTSTSSTYAVGASSYSIAVRFPHECWVRIDSPADSSNVLVAQVLTNSDSPKVVPVNGSATVNLGAATTSITIVENGRTLGVIETPLVGRDYDFIPSR